MDSDKAFAIGVCVFLGLLVLTVILVVTSRHVSPSPQCPPGGCHYSDLINPGSNVRYPVGM